MKATKADKQVKGNGKGRSGKRPAAKKMAALVPSVAAGRGTVRTSISISYEAAEAGREIARRENRAFSNVVDTLLRAYAAGQGLRDEPGRKEAA